MFLLLFLLWYFFRFSSSFPAAEAGGVATRRRCCLSTSCTMRRNNPAPPRAPERIAERVLNYNPVLSPVVHRRPPCVCCFSGRSCGNDARACSAEDDRVYFLTSRYSGVVVIAGTAHRWRQGLVRAKSTPQGVIYAMRAPEERAPPTRVD